MTAADDGSIAERQSESLLAVDEATPSIEMTSPDRFINRELSWLEFNNRVLEEASNPRHPLLERLRFLSISASNLDEFYMVRVAGLRGHVREGVSALSQEGLTAEQQLVKIDKQAQRLMANQQECWRHLLPAMAEAGIEVIEASQLSEVETAWLEEDFLANIFPVLTPIALDPAHPFPFVPNLGFVLCMNLKRRDGETFTNIVSLPKQIKRFIRLPSTEGSKIRFIALERVIVRFVDHLFPRMKLQEHGAFRIIRDSDIEIEEEAEDLMRVFETMLQRRRRGDVIRLKIEESMPEAMRNLVIERLGATPQDVILVKGILGLAQTTQLILTKKFLVPG